MAKPFIEVSVKEDEFQDALKMLKDMEESIDSKWIKMTLRRKSKPMQSKMKSAVMSKFGSERLASMVGASTAKKRTFGQAAIRVGVVKNNATLFPVINSFGLAAILEYGTVERYRTVRAAGIITGKAPTGKVKPTPWLRPSYDREIGPMIDDFGDTVIKRVEKAAR